MNREHVLQQLAPVDLVTDKGLRPELRDCIEREALRA
jgi:predicted nucleotidyltransferase